MKFADFIHPDALVVPLASGDRDGAIGELVAVLGRARAIEATSVALVVESLLARERAGTTGFGRGVAVPHAKLPQVPRCVGAVGISANGLDFAALDRRPVYAVVVLLTPKGQDATHLQAMETTFRSLDQESFRRALRQAATPADVRAILDEADLAKRSSGGGGLGSTGGGDARARVF